MLFFLFSNVVGFIIKPMQKYKYNLRNSYFLIYLFKNKGKSAQALGALMWIIFAKVGAI